MLSVVGDGLESLRASNAQGVLNPREYHRRSADDDDEVAAERRRPNHEARSALFEKS